MTSQLIESLEFTSAAGLKLPFKINCDALSNMELEHIAVVAAKKLQPFSNVVYVPSGGKRLAYELSYYVGNIGPTLVVDDVWTTGSSMLKKVNSVGLSDGDWIGFVIFNRGLILPNNVKAFFNLGDTFR